VNPTKELKTVVGEPVEKEKVIKMGRRVQKLKNWLKKRVQKKKGGKVPKNESPDPVGREFGKSPPARKLGPQKSFAGKGNPKKLRKETLGAKIFGNLKRQELETPGKINPKENCPPKGWKGGNPK